jgi:hypothetical protein
MYLLLVKDDILQAHSFDSACEITSDAVRILLMLSQAHINGEIDNMNWQRTFYILVFCEFSIDIHKYIHAAKLFR